MSIPHQQRQPELQRWSDTGMETYDLATGTGLTAAAGEALVPKAEARAVHQIALT